MCPWAPRQDGGERKGESHLGREWLRPHRKAAWGRLASCTRTTPALEPQWERAAVERTPLSPPNGAMSTEQSPRKEQSRTGADPNDTGLGMGISTPFPPGSGPSRLLPRLPLSQPHAGGCGPQDPSRCPADVPPSALPAARYKVWHSGGEDRLFPPVKAGARPHCTTPAPPVPGPAARCSSARLWTAPAFPARLQRARTKPQVHRRLPLSPSLAPEAVSQPLSENRSREAGLSSCFGRSPLDGPAGGSRWRSAGGGGGSGSPRPCTHGRPDKDLPERSSPTGAGLGLPGTRALPWPWATRRRVVTLLPAEHKETIEGCPPPAPPGVGSLAEVAAHGAQCPQHRVPAGGCGMRTSGFLRRNRGALSLCLAVLWVPRSRCPLPVPGAGVWAHSHGAAAFTWHQSRAGIWGELKRSAVLCGDGRWQHGTLRPARRSVPGLPACSPCR